MPVHDLGYRPWEGRRTPQLLRPYFVARGGISLVWRKKWLRLMLMLGWLPIIVPAFGIFIFEYSSTDGGIQRMVFQLLRGPLNQPELATRAITNPETARHDVWATLILAYFRYPQLTAMVLLVGLIAPMLVSYDLRSRAYLQYFSRPLSPGEYILGKSAVLWFFLGLIVTLPAIILYAVGVMLSPDLSVVIETWDIPLRILAASAVLLIPTTALALCYSSWTSESRYAAFAWFATWVMGYVAYRILTFSGAQGGPRRRGRKMQEYDLDVDLDKWRLLSPYDTLGKVESWVFGLDPTPGSVVPAVALLTATTVVGIWIVHWRIVSRLSV